MRRRPLLLATALLSLLGGGFVSGSLAGCDSTEISPLSFDPFDAEGGIFSIYGVLDARALDQAARVQLLRRDAERPQTPEDAAVDAAVYTDVVGGGPRVAWVPRTVRFPDSSYGVVYEATFQPRAGTTYRLSVERGANLATAAVTVPLQPRATPEPFDAAGLTQAFTWAPVARVSDTRVVFRVGCGQGGTAVPVPGALRVTPTADGARTTLDLAAARARLDAHFGVPPDSLLFVAAVSLAVTVTDADWTLPADSSDFAQPGNGNVEGGYGRLGAVNRGSVAWEPEARSLDALALGVCPEP